MYKRVSKPVLSLNSSKLISCYLLSFPSTKSVDRVGSKTEDDLITDKSIFNKRGGELGFPESLIWANLSAKVSLCLVRSDGDTLLNTLTNNSSKITYLLLAKSVYGTSFNLSLRLNRSMNVSIKKEREYSYKK